MLVWLSWKPGEFYDDAMTVDAYLYSVYFIQNGPLSLFYSVQYPETGAIIIFHPLTSRFINNIRNSVLKFKRRKWDCTRNMTALSKLSSVPSLSLSLSPLPFPSVAASVGHASVLFPLCSMCSSLFAVQRRRSWLHWHIHALQKLVKNG